METGVPIRFQIVVPETIDAKISAWNLPAAIHRSMEDRLRNDLANDPQNVLIPCVAPWEERLNLYSFIIRESESVQHWFMFHFVYGQDEASLEMVERGYIYRTEPGGPKLPTS
jgi:hypothetical protein